jgi:CxxC motif-containing protein (DUF1111 family)
MKRPNGVVSLLFAGATAVFLASFTLAIEGQNITAAATEAPAGFDNKTNGAISQDEFDDAKEDFAEQEKFPDDGLGPVYNAQSCGECHQNPVTGGISQVAELRAGHQDASGNFVDAPGGSLINDRAVDASIQERVPGTEDIRTLRMSMNTLGDGFVEAISDADLINNAKSQPGRSGGRIAGQWINVPVLEDPGDARNPGTRVGRFGWKDQHASLLSFSSDAYLNEMGITNRFNLSENTSMGRLVNFKPFDPFPNDETLACANNQGFCGEDPDDDITLFAAFMRATKVPPRDAALINGRSTSSDVSAGAAIFDKIGCEICHTKTFVTMPVGTKINGGLFPYAVTAAIGNKIIHPYSDFMLHDVGTGDGIVQNGGPANKIRTRALWGVRTNDRHMHDGLSLTFNEAILRHRGEASAVTSNYNSLTTAQKNQLITFLKSL